MNSLRAKCVLAIMIFGKTTAPHPPPFVYLRSHFYEGHVSISYNVYIPEFALFTSERVTYPQPYYSDLETRGALVCMTNGG